MRPAVWRVWESRIKCSKSDAFHEDVPHRWLPSPPWLFALLPGWANGDEDVMYAELEDGNAPVCGGYGAASNSKLP